ncbi:MAG: DUF4157 domain-containing protein [Prolixibacteraceae bacterium]
MKSPIQKFKKTSNSNNKSNRKIGPFIGEENNNSFFKNELQKADSFFTPTVKKQNNELNKTGMSEKLKAGIENLSGIDMSDVKVHRNSSRPKQLDALAYTQGTDIFLGPGQEQHLPHEAWHVVQQKQGRVNGTKQLGKDKINDDISLEQEATQMGHKALSSTSSEIARRTAMITTEPKNIVQNKIIQREPIPSSAIILDVNAAAEQVLQNLISTARATSPQHSSVNWRNMFLGAITQQITGRRLGTIAHSWRDNEGLDASWTVTLSFDQIGAQRTERPSEQRSVTNTAGGTSSNSLGSSQSNTTGSSVSVSGGSSSSAGVEAGPVSAEQGSSRSGTVGLNDSHTTGSSGSSGGGMSSGASSASTESVNRYIASLRVNIDCTAEAAYSNWDIINPAKWGGHLAGRQHRNYTFIIGTITYDLPDY